MEKELLYQIAEKLLESEKEKLSKEDMNNETRIMMELIISQSLTMIYQFIYEYEKLKE